MSRAAKGLSALMIAVAGFTAAAAAQTPDRVAASVRKAFADYEKRLNSADYAGALEYYADDPRFFWVEQGKVVARSKAEIGKGYQKLKGSGTHMTYEPLVVTVLWPTAAVITTSFSATMGTGPQAAQFSGLLTLVVVRAAAGWRFLIGRG